MNEVLARLAPDVAEALPALCRRFGVRRLDLFGSAADGRFDPGRSDLDFLVAFDDLPGAAAFHLLDMKAALETLFGRDVDLVDQSKVENPFVRRRIDGQRQQLFPATRMTGLIPGYVWHARRSAEGIARMTAGRSLDDYLADRMLQLAVEREFITIGEALTKLRKVDRELAESIPEMANIIGFRNLLVHAYEEVQDRAVWTTVETRLADLLAVLNRLLEEAGET